MYKPVPHIKDLHDFVWQKVADDRPRLQVQQLCNKGQHNFVNVYCAADGVVAGIRPLENAPPINTEKMVHLKEMYDWWISPDRRLDILASFVAQPAPALPALQPPQPVTAALAVAHHQQRTRQKCSTPGCSGQGHKNLQRWAEGHTTRSGCPFIHNV